MSTSIAKVSCKTEPAGRSTFGITIAVAPNTIDFSAGMNKLHYSEWTNGIKVLHSYSIDKSIYFSVWANFANLSENAAVFSTIVAFVLTYLLLLVWSNYMDRRDIERVGRPFSNLPERGVTICLYPINGSKI